MTLRERHSHAHFTADVGALEHSADVMTREKQKAGPPKVRWTEPHEFVALDSVRLAKLRIALVAIFAIGATFFALGMYLTVYVRAAIFEGPVFLAIGGTGIYSAIRSPDRLLIQWLRKVFIAI
jgi:hypothetical protein